MFSLSDIFTPSFFIILGIIVMLIALLVVYIENKWREQNHKIASMLSLVSSLAEEMNGMRFHLMSGGNGSESNPNITKLDFNTFFPNNSNISPSLIEISDGEEEDEEEEEDKEDEEEGEEEDEDEDEENEEDDDDDDNKTTIFKLNLSDEDDFEDDNEDINVTQEIIEIGNESEVKVLKINDFHSGNLEEEVDIHFISDLDTFESVNEEKELLQSSDLKSISFSLEENDKEFKNDNSTKDLKKAPLQLLRNLVIEKKLMSDPSKLKKHELLKLLGLEHEK